MQRAQSYSQAYMTSGSIDVRARDPATYTAASHCARCGTMWDKEYAEGLCEPEGLTVLENDVGILFAYAM